jgi:hypothetical protein
MLFKENLDHGQTRGDRLLLRKSNEEGKTGGVAHSLKESRLDINMSRNV